MIKRVNSVFATWLALLCIGTILLLFAILAA